MGERNKVAIEKSNVNVEFRIDKLFMKSHWRLLDDRIIVYTKGGLVEELFLEDITRFHVFNPHTGQIQLFAGSKLYNLLAEMDDPELRKAGEYIRENCGVNQRKKILDSLEWRMRCNVCGHVFCYSYNDLVNNSHFAKMSQVYSRGAIIDALVGTQMGMYANMKLSNDAIGKITDYSRCPHCNSSDLTEITVDEPDTNKQYNPSTTQNVADEIKKFKELLDIGAITKEEFEAKKKQLLGV